MHCFYFLVNKRKASFQVRATFSPPFHKLWSFCWWSNEKMPYIQMTSPWDLNCQLRRGCKKRLWFIIDPPEVESITENHRQSSFGHDSHRIFRCVFFSDSEKIRSTQWTFHVLLGTPKLTLWQIFLTNIQTNTFIWCNILWNKCRFQNTSNNITISDKRHDTFSILWILLGHWNREKGEGNWI